MKKSTSAAAFALHSAIAGLGLLSPLSLYAQTTVTYTDAQVSTTNRVTTAANPLTFTLASGTATEDGVISGDGTLTKSGAGTLALTGANTYTGITVISAGTLQIGNGGTTGSIASSLLNNGSLIFNRSDTLTHSRVISGTGSVTQSGTGKLTLSGNNTYSGGTFVAAGTLGIGSNNAVGAGAITITGGGIRAEGQARTLSNALFTSGTITVGRSTTFAGATTLNAATTFIASNADGAANANTTFSGPIGGNFRVTLAEGAGSLGIGTGYIVFSGTNTYTGGTTLSTRLSINSDAALGAPSGTLTMNGGTLRGTAAISSVRNVSLGSAGGTFDIGSASSISGTVSGSGALTKSGAGTLTLSGATAYTGGTTIAGGTLSITGAFGPVTLGEGNYAGAISNAGTFAISTDGYQKLSGIISGSGSLVKSGSGQLMLTGANTYTGDTTITGGTLFIADELLGAGNYAGAISNDGTLIFSTFDQTLSGIISGPGRLEHMSYARLTLTGNNTYTGVTTISIGGAVQIGNGGTTGSLAGDVTFVDDGYSPTLVFNRSDASNYAGVISGSGSLTQAGAGTLTLTGANTYTGVTTLSGGALQIGDGGTTGSLVGDVGNDTSLTFNRSDAATYAGAISGSGSVTQAGAGTLTLTGANTYTGVTTLSGGALQIGDGGTTGSLAGDIVDNTSLTFNRSDATTFAGVISGSGSVTQAGTGTLTLPNANTYAGGTAITGGQLTMADAGALGTGSVSVSNGATLDAASYGFDLNRLSGAGTITTSGAYTASPASNVILATKLAGTASLTKTGAGTLTLSGANTYSGGTTITGGLVGFTTAANLGTGNITLDGGGLLWPTSTYIDISSRLNPIGAGGATFAFDGAYSNLATFATALTGPGGITKEGIGTLYLSAANTYLGATTIRDGEVGIRNNGVTTFGTLGSGLTTVGEGRYASLQFYDAASAGNGTFIANVGAGISFNGTSTASHGTFTMAGGTVSDGYGGDLAFQQQASAGSANITLNGGTAAGAFGGNLYVADTADLGTATITVNGGTNGGLGAGITFYNDATGGTATVKLYGNGFLDLTNSTHSSGDSSPDLANNVSIGSLEGDGRILLGGGLTVGTNNASTVFSGVIQDGVSFYIYTPDYSLTKTGTGTFTLSGANTYSGGTTINGGRLTMGSAGALGTGSVGVASGTTLDAAGYGFDLNRLSGAGTITSSGTYTASPASDVTLATNLTGTASLAKTGAGTLTLTGTNTYSGGTSLSGWGTLEFSSAANLGTGNITLDGGILKWAAGNTADISSRLNINENGGAFDTNGNNVTFASAIVGAPSYSQFVKIGAGTLSLSGATVTEFFVGGGTLVLGTGAYQGNDLYIGGNFGLDSDSYSPTAVILSGAGTSFSVDGDAFIGVSNEFSASLTVSGGASFSSTGSGTYIGQDSTAESTLTVTGAGSTYANSGYLQIGTSSSGRSSFIVSDGASASAGTTVIGRLGVLGANSLTLTGAGSTFTNTGTLTLAESAVSNGILNLGSAAGTAATAAGILDTATVTGGAGTATLQFNTTGTALAPAYFTRDGTLTGTGVNTAGGLSLVNTAGTTVLSGTLAHTGATWINGGTLRVNGSLVSSAVTVANGATLGGGGSIGGFTTLASGAHLAPGNSPGTLTFTGGLALNTGSILDFELGTVSDLIRVSGGTLSGPSSGTITLNLTDSGGFSAGVYTLIDASGASLSSIGATSFQLGTTIAGYTYSFGQNGDLFQLIATSAIPEPATFGMLVGAAVLGLASQRRRRR